MKKIKNYTSYQGLGLDVERAYFELSDGKIMARDIIHRVPAAAVLAINENNEVYLINQMRYPFEKELYEIPCGKANPGEDILDTAKRELREETGIVAETYTCIGKIYPSPGVFAEDITLFVATGLSFGKTDFDADENITTVELNLRDAFGLVESNYIKDAKTQIAILRVASTYLYLHKTVNKLRDKPVSDIFALKNIKI